MAGTQGLVLPPAAAELAERRARLLTEGGCGRAYEIAHARLFDEYFARRLREEEALLPRAPYLLLAQGGYGRGRMSPHSDIDLTILFIDGVPDGAEALARALFYPLWDLGMTLDYSLRSQAESLALVRSDPKVLAALLDARPLAGSGGDSLWQGFHAAFLDELAGRAREDFLAWLARVDEPKAAEHGEGASLLEPDLKEGPGGLRDWQQIGWLSRLFPGREGANLFELGLLEPSEIFALSESAERVAQVRCALHRVTGRRQDLLYFELQEEVAAVLGDDGGPRAAAALLSGLQPAMARIRLAREAMTREVEGRLAGHGRLHALPEGLADTPGGLGFVEDPLKNPGLVLSLFETAASTGRMLSFSAMSAVRRSLPAVGEKLGGALGVYHYLPRLLALEGGRAAGRAFLELGVLGALVPEIGAVQNLVQRDGFHRFPVGRHSLRTARILARPQEEEDAPEALAEILAETEDSEVLVWAGLLHDVGKGNPAHERVGEGLARAALSRMGVSPGRIEEVAFLVRSHLLLMETATRRDLGDVSTAGRVAALVGGAERLRALTALSMADAMATGPMAWNGWKGMLMTELYRKAMRLLTSGPLAEPLAGRQVMERRDQVRALAVASEYRDILEDFLDALPPDCFLRLPPQAVNRHLGLYARYRQALEEDRQLRTGKNAGRGLTVHEARHLEGVGAWEFAVMAPDQPRLFATLAGCISLCGGDILAADIFTLSDGTALDVFVVQCPKNGPDCPEMWSQVARNVRWALTDKLSLDYRIGERRASPLYRAPRGTGKEPSVLFDNGISDFFTVVEVAADDRLGRLYDIAAVLADSSVGIHSAKITTHGGQILDVFMVRGQGGVKLEDEAAQDALRKALIKRLRDSR
ncbi:UTP-GlnB uridylyltransferase, GlnD / adenyl transferase, GlnE [Desulfovibrio sp. X2]|uniref:[protein-PII] uridylyltransferase family protein n=1 Tax=Desulfovibrio sp. X2 TaxID=941449 RepID=UPI000358B278|nr:HD domain-containing protein [Desulfovibrio sp. X2]EPR38705.1 UTP-GlnB uridylyltransferase, GlnD / adenyl transferase, GlnE [Desulfovibrio sp. X2]